MLYRNLTDQVLTVVVGAESVQFPPNAYAELPSNWASIVANRGTLVINAEESDEPEDMRMRYALALGVEPHEVILDSDPVKPEAPRPKPKRKR